MRSVEHCEAEWMAGTAFGHSRRETRSNAETVVMMCEPVGRCRSKAAFPLTTFAE